jgi:hypothetical protein
MCYSRASFSSCLKRFCMYEQAKQSYDIPAQCPSLSSWIGCSRRGRLLCAVCVSGGCTVLAFGPLSVLCRRRNNNLKACSRRCVVHSKKGGSMRRCAGILQLVNSTAMDGVITADHSLNELYDWYFQYEKAGCWFMGFRCSIAIQPYGHSAIRTVKSLCELLYSPPRLFSCPN